MTKALDDTARHHIMVMIDIAGVMSLHAQRVATSKETQLHFQASTEWHFYHDPGC